MYVQSASFLFSAYSEYYFVVAGSFIQMFIINAEEFFKSVAPTLVAGQVMNTWKYCLILNLIYVLESYF